MIKNETLQDKKIYDNYENLMENSKNNFIVRIYKLVILGLIALATLMILIFAKQTIMGEKIWKSINRNISSFLSFEDPTTEQANTVILFKTTLLLFTLYYCLIKNYLNLHIQKDLIKKYYIWFSLYSSMLLISFVLLFTYNSAYPFANFCLLFLLVPLYLINIAQRLYLHFYKAKTDPINYGNKIYLILPLVSQGFLVASILAIFFAWNASAQMKNILFYQNKFNDFIKSTLTTKSALNLFIVIVFFIYMALLLLLTNLEKIVFLINKRFTREYFTFHLQIVLTIFFAAILCLIPAFIWKIPATNYLGTLNKNEYFFLFEIFFAALILCSYCLLVFKAKQKINGSLLSTLYFSLHQLVLWLSLLIVSLYKQNSHITLANIFTISIISFAMIAIYIIKTKNIDVLTMLLLILNITFNIFTLTISMLNQLLLQNKNFAFYVIAANVSLIQIFLILQATFTAILFIANFAQLNKTLYRLTNLKSNNNVALETANIKK